MRATTPDWVLTALWFLAGVGGTGAFWYYLSQKAQHSALWTGFFTGVVLLLTISLQIRNNLIKEEQPAVEAGAPTAPERRPQVFFKQSAFVGRLGDNANMAVDLLLGNSGAVEARGAFENISFRFEPSPFAKELRYLAEGTSGKFDLAPSQEANIRIGSMLPLTPQMIAALVSDPPQARLYIFAKGWYSNPEGSTKYDLSFCRIYHPSMPGNLIYCPSDVAVVSP
jgi:hypothetical protein